MHLTLFFLFGDLLTLQDFWTAEDMARFCAELWQQQDNALLVYQVPSLSRCEGLVRDMFAARKGRLLRQLLEQMQ